MASGTMLAYEYQPIPNPSKVTTMGKHKKAKSKIPKRSRPLPPHLQAQLQSHFQQKRDNERSADVDGVDMGNENRWAEDLESDDWWDELEEDDGFGCSGFEAMDFGEEFEIPFPRLKDFASLEEYNEYHVRSMLAAGVPPNEIDLDIVLPSFVEAMQFETEEEIRNSPEWHSTVAQVGLEKAERMMRGVKPQVDVYRRESQKRARRNK